MALIENFEKLLAAGKDSALLRFSLGNEYFKAGAAGRAIEHLQHAVAQDASYSAAWKILGSALVREERFAEALDAYAHGIDAAERHGDKQAAKEMQVFRRRAEKSLAAQSGDPAADI